MFCCQKFSVLSRTQRDLLDRAGSVSVAGKHLLAAQNDPDRPTHMFGGHRRHDGMRPGKPFRPKSAPNKIRIQPYIVGRYAEDVEVAVYFCCLEALQNVAKHAGPDATATVVLREDEALLRFEVRDSGVGFSPRTVQRGSGLINMRDRIEAVGGELAVTSRRGRGTAVRGSVPVG